MSTIAPHQTRAIGAELAARDIALLDAPVTGSSPKAEDGTLTIMAGGAPKTSSAPGPCSRSWASSSSTPARSATARS